MRYLIAILIAAFSILQTQACSCIFIETFCESLTFNTEDELQEGLIIIHGKVTAQLNSGVQVEVLTNIHGDLSENQIRINSGNGADCRLNTSQFQENQEFIFATYESSSGFYLNECGVSFLSVRNNRITGSISPGINSVSINNFKRGLNNCGTFDFGYEINIFPNPTFGNLSLNIASNQEEEMELNVYNVEGRLIQSKAWADPRSIMESIDIADFPAGLYILQFKYLGIVEYKKVIKQ
jgi:hypothetical protein